MAEAEDAPAMALPAPNPDAQTTVNDFLDYTEFFPSDLARSLTLIGDLDATYKEAVWQVHELTSLYGRLPSLPEEERPDPTLLRKQIAQHLHKAVSQREYASTEAARLHEVTVRHCQRSSIIKRKLQAQPQPPSRDPTPVPVSPQAQRALHRTYERTPHLRLTFDGGRHGAARQHDGHRKFAARSRRRSRAHSASDDSDGESDIRSTIDFGKSPRRPKQNRDRYAKPVRPRPAGVLGTNVHSSIAGISTSNALAQLEPPPPNARPGSKWAPWLKLTEYEMAVLRKQMKKNAVWTPSLTMVNSQLQKKNRTRDDYEREKARCEATGEEMLDEEPESLQALMTASGLGQLEQVGPRADTVDSERDAPREERGTISIRLKPTAAKEGRRLDRLSQRQQAMRDAQDLENATSKLQQAADSLKELTFTAHAVAPPASQKKKPAARSNKRKRDTTPAPATESAANTPREASVATQDSGTRQPERKRPRLQLIAPAPSGTSSPMGTPASAVSTPRDIPTSVAPSPAALIPVPIPELVRAPTNGSSVQVPLAPAGPSTPKAIRTPSKEPIRSPTPIVVLPTEPEEPEAVEDLEVLEEAPEPEEIEEPVTLEEAQEPEEVEEPETIEELEELEHILESEEFQEPETTQQLEEIEEPEATHEPEVPQEPEATQEPEVTQEPEATHEPEEIQGPDESQEPDGNLEQDDIAELEEIEELAEPEIAEEIVEAEEPRAMEEVPTVAVPEPPPPPSVPAALPAPTVTAASSRPRRESVAPKAATPIDAPPAPVKTSKPSTPAPETIPEAPALAHTIRPRSARGLVPTPKAQSEEPKPNDVTRVTRESRRHSVFSQSIAPGHQKRMSSRKKPPPKGEVTAAEDGQKTVTNVKRAQGSKNNKKNKEEEEPETGDDIDPDEERYCICDDVSYGPMISCDNNVGILHPFLGGSANMLQCDKEWFHMPCVNMTETDIPSRRTKWYCPDCRVSLGVDAYGNPLVPPPLPGRRGNR
jgi:hypothetical protein